MERPLDGTVFEDKNEYWDSVGFGPGMPAWAFDFVSVHVDPLLDCRKPLTFSLVSPMCLVEHPSAKRPAWEQKKFKTQEAATAFAVKLALKHGLFVVDCCGR